MATKAFDTPILTNDQSIDRVLAAGLPVLLVFLNGPLPAAFKEALERIASARAGKLLVAQVQIRENPQTSARFQIAQAPAVIDVRNGQAVARAALSSAAELKRHAAFLLGEAPRPESPSPQTTQAPHPAANGAAGQGGHPQTVTDATFDRDVMHAAQPVLVDFWAPWCGPCRMVAPTVEKLAREYAGKAAIYKMNVDENPQTAQRYRIYSIPTMMVVKNGQIVDRWAGALPEPALRSRVEPKLR